MYRLCTRCSDFAIELSLVQSQSCHCSGANKAASDGDGSRPFAPENVRQHVERQLTSHFLMVLSLAYGRLRSDASAYHRSCLQRERYSGSNPREKAAQTSKRGLGEAWKQTKRDQIWMLFSPFSDHTTAFPTSSHTFRHSFDPSVGTTCSLSLQHTLAYHSQHDATILLCQAAR